MVTGQDAPRHGYMAVSEEGRSEERSRNGAASRLSSVAVKLLIWGSWRPTPRGKQAEGAVWVKMNVNEKSTGVPDAWGSRVEAAGRSERKKRGRAESGSRYGARFAKKEANKENEMD